MAKLSIFLDKRTPNTKGLYPIKIRINNGTSATSVSSKMYVSEKAFVGDTDKAVEKSFPNASVINTRVKQMYLEYTEAITKLDYEGKLQRITAAGIKSYVQRQKNAEVEETTFSTEMERYIANCRSPKTKEGYEYARNMLHKYMKKNTIHFDELTYPVLVAFDRWMEQQELSINTRGIVMRYIRSVFNAAINADKLSPSIYPFRKFTIKKAQKEKEFLTLDEMQKLRSLELKGNQAVARDFFLLSFYLCGVNPTDLFHFQKANKKGNLVFVRQKIAHTEPTPLHLHIQPEAQEIIDRYAGEEHLLYFIERYYEFETFRHNMSKKLTEIGKLMDRHIYFYLARYTWATFADHVGVSHDVISKALGHSDKSTAEKYYISFNWDRANAANRQVIDYLNGK